MTRLNLSQPETVANDGRSFHALFLVNGNLDIEGNGTAVRVGLGTSVLLPAAVQKYVIKPLDGHATMIRAGLV